MTTPVKHGLSALTEKEKQTLRLIVRGHDAKSIARNFSLSVHTINERLRDARRKMAVSSSREAARLLLEAESGDPGLPSQNLLEDTQIGDAPPQPDVDHETAPNIGVRQAYRLPWIIVGGILMALVLSALALTLSPIVASSPSPPPTAAQSAPNPEVVNTAQKWLALLDQGLWDETYQQTGSAFRKLNSAKAWAEASEHARASLGPVVSREFLSEQDLPAPPNGYQVVKFRASFTKKAIATQTVTLEREGGTWRVVGVTIE